MRDRSRAILFDVDHTSLNSLQELLSGWDMVIINGATTASLARGWNPGAADLLVVGACGEITNLLGLCRFLAYCTTYSEDSRQERIAPLGKDASGQSLARRTDAPLLVLVSPGQEDLVQSLLEAGAHSCLVRPFHAREVTSMLARARAGNQAGRHTLNLEGAQQEDPWRDAGGGEA
jgi:phosphoserine phosphatase